MAPTEESSEVTYLKRQITDLKFALENRDRDNLSLKAAVINQGLIEDQNKSYERQIIALEVELEKRKCLARALALEKAKTEEQRVLVEKERREKKRFEHLYKQEKASKNELHLQHEKLQRTFDERDREFNQTMYTLEQQMQKLHKQNTNLKNEMINFNGLKAQLYEKDKALAKEIHKTTRLEENLRKATREIKAQLNSVNIRFDLPNNVDDKELLLRYIKLYQRHIIRYQQEEKMQWKLEKKLEEARVACIENDQKVESTIRKNRTEDALKISELQSIIRKKKEENQQLQTERTMYSSHAEQLEAENDRLKEKLNKYKKHFIQTEFQAAKSIPQKKNIDKTYQVQPNENTPAISHQPFNLYTPLPPISVKRQTFLTQR